MGCELTNLETGVRFVNRRAAITAEVETYFRNFETYQANILSAFRDVYEAYTNENITPAVTSAVNFLRMELFSKEEFEDITDKKSIEKALPQLFNMEGDVLINQALFSSLVAESDTVKAKSYKAAERVEAFLTTYRAVALIDSTLLLQLKNDLDLAQNHYGAALHAEKLHAYKALLKESLQIHNSIESLKGAMQNAFNTVTYEPKTFALDKANFSDLLGISQTARLKELPTFLRMATDKINNLVAEYEQGRLVLERQRLIQAHQNLVQASNLNPYPNGKGFSSSDITNFKLAFFSLSTQAQQQALEVMNNPLVLADSIVNLETLAANLAEKTKNLSTSQIKNMLFAHLEAVECA